MNNLFRGRQNEQLAQKCDPRDLDEFFGQEKLLAEDGPLFKLIVKDKMLSSVFYGPPGCGKTALAKIIARRTKSEFIRLNAVTAKTDDLRASLKTAQQNRLIGNSTLLFIDEIHRFNKMVQDGLLPALEEDLVTLIGTTTKNPFFYLIPPLRSRILLFEFEKLSQDALGLILKQAERREGFTLEEKARDYLIQFSNGDARRMFNLLQTALVLSELSNVTVDDLEKIIQRQQVLYDRDEDYHFDIISAYIKSIRGSDPDASLHWLSLMLEGGEDPLYIARRLIVLASEDIGLADSFSLVLAVAAYDAVDMIGMPEARIILSHVTLYLALQPKSNSSYLAISKALEYVKTKETGDVPDYLKSSHPAVKNYRYPHDFKYHYVVQEYMKERLRFYEPGILGQEREMKKRLDFLKNLRKEEHNDQQEGDS
jgi:putative ATPase